MHKETQIQVERGLLFSEDLLIALRSLANRFIILTDRNVAECHGDRFYHFLKQGGLLCDLIVIEPGEEQKNRKTKELIEDQMFHLGCNRDCALLALGGGVITDLAAFIASTFCRGIPLVLLPTSLLAMVDASIGGKTGINHPSGKNLIGTFYPSDFTVMDPNVLSTLPLKEYRSGMAEVIKHSLIHSRESFDALSEKGIEEIIKESIQIKSGIVKKDPLERGLRRVLNLGHTLGHALETLMNYQTPHGYCVAVGISVESEMSFKKGFLSERDLLSIRECLRSHELPTTLPKGIEISELLHFCQSDKKSFKGSARMVYLEEIGKVKSFDGEYCAPLSTV